MPRREGGVPERLFVDSGAWVAFFSARDGRHADADRSFREAIRQKVPLLTSNLVLAEVHRLLLFRAGIRAAATALERIDASPSVTVKFADMSVHRQARAWLAKLGDQVITYTDAASFALMQANRCTVALSFDRDFAIAGYTLWNG
ncbi:MAG TPA: PIN domain-containing protein [Myxococcaceae bacterium]|nr:PIN domain-containing protein [Myxococcaceae bacterium]